VKDYAVQPDDTFEIREKDPIELGAGYYQQEIWKSD
jgi:hypothetical protein